jgi:osmotically-inducible protein OsmY
MRPLGFLCLFTIICISLACTRKGNEVGSDQAIAQDIEKKVANEPQTEQPKLKVDAHDGEVILYGKANSETARQLIETIAWEEPGVKSVDNQMTIEGEEAAAPILSNR